MSLAGLLQDLRQAGIALALDGDGLRIQAPKGAAMRERLLEHKQALVHWLRETLSDDGPHRCR